MTHMIKKKLNMISGFNPSTLKRFILFYFGQDYFIRIKKNRDNVSYDIYLLEVVNGKKINQDRVDEWTKYYWGRQYRAIVIPDTLCAEINEKL